MKRIFIAGFQHESNTFCPYPATIKSYLEYETSRGQEIIDHFKGSGHELGGYIDVLEASGDEIVPSVFAKTCPAGPVTVETFEYFKNMIISDYKAAGHIDGILLALHGAMLTDDSEDGEGLLLKALRAVTGPELPIVVTLDFHANVTEDMVDNSTAMVTSRYYPHTDFYEIGVRGARILLDVIDGKIKPVAAFRRLPLIYPHMPTDEGPLSVLIPKLIARQQDKDVMLVSFIAGFARADISIQGACIYALTDGDVELARQLCDEYYDDVVEHIREYRMQLTPPCEAVKKAMEHEGLAVIADASDNPGSGAMSDATDIIHEMRKQGVHDAAVAFIWDPETVKQAFEAGPGAFIDVVLGGKSSDKVGEPVRAKAYVRSIGDGKYTVKGPMFTNVAMHLGMTAVLDIDGIVVITVSEREQPFDEQVFRSNGIEPLDKKMVVLKSAVHFRAAWKKVSDLLMIVDEPNLTSIDELKVGFRKIPHPIYPFDDILG